MEWVQSRDGTEARRVPDGIEVRMIGKTDSTVYKVKPANEPALKKAYPELFIRDMATGEEPAAALAAAPAVRAKKPRKAKKK